MIDHTVAQVFALFVSSSSPCLMRTLSDSLSLSDFSIYLTFHLFITFIFLHFLLPFTFYFLVVVDYNHRALPLRSWVPRTKRTPPQNEIQEDRIEYFK